jgi:hypothetical protein
MIWVRREVKVRLERAKKIEEEPLYKVIARALDELGWS